MRARGKNQSIWTKWSELASLETGLLERQDWTAKLVTAPWSNENKNGPQPEDLFRKEFVLLDGITSARLYITSQGVYKAELNGIQVGDDFLTPGWTSCGGRLQYQTYDVTTQLLNQNDHCIGIRVAEGWFSGRLGFDERVRCIWGSRPAAFAQLEVRYADGTIQRIVTDETWTVSQGSIKLAEIYDGEKYDATAEILGWSRSGSVPGTWVAVDALPPLTGSTKLTSGFSEPVRCTKTFKAVDEAKIASGSYILNFGQNLAGVIRLRNIRGKRGHKITITHAEVLDEHGELCRRPLADCEARDTYTLSGDPKGESYEPRFTFHGFQYVQVQG